MHVILVDEVPDYLVNVFASPIQPVFNSWLNIKDGPTVKLGRIHLANLILLTVLATVDSGKNQSLRVKLKASKLPRVGQLKDTLANFGSRTVNLIKEKHHGSLTRSFEPLGRVPGGDITVSGGKTKQVALGHLRSTTLHNRKTHNTSKLINNLGLTNTVASANQNWFANRSDVGNNGNKSFKVNSH